MNTRSDHILLHASFELIHASYEAFTIDWTARPGVVYNAPDLVRERREELLASRQARPVNQETRANPDSIQLVRTDISRPYTR